MAKPRTPKPADQVRKELDALGLSVEDLSRMFKLSVRSARSWTTGATRVPNWVIPALQIYRRLPPAARVAALEGLVLDGAHAGTGRPAASNRLGAHAPRHPFARIEEL